MTTTTTAKNQAPRQARSAPAAGTVYLIHSPATGLHKIGMTENWIRRAKELRVGDGIDLIAKTQTFNPKGVEAARHHQFQALRLPQSEWFQLSARDLAFICKAFEMAGESFKTKNQDPKVRLLVLRAKYAKERNPKRKKVLGSVIDMLHKQTDPDGHAKATQDRVDAADRQREENAAAQRLEWNTKPLLNQLLTNWWITTVIAGFSLFPGLLVTGALGIAADAIFCNGQSDSTCSSKVRDGMLGGGIATAAVLYIGGMAAVTAQAARQKKSFLAAQKEEGK